MGIQVDKQQLKGGLIGKMNVDVALSENREFVRGGDKHAWYIPNVNVYPQQQTLYNDLRRVIRDHVLPGHLPSTALLDESSAVVTLGSCFARELRAALSQAGIESSRFWIPSGLNNTFAILDFFSWCVTGKETGRGFRYDRDQTGEIKEWTPEGERHGYAQALAQAGAFVFTLGLAEVWQDRDSGMVFWRGVPEHIFDSNRHVFRLTTVEENRRNIEEIIALVRQINPTAPIVLTLSPVPLLASFREISCLTADSVSKSVLRVALDLVLSDAPPSVFYWPSFEIVKWVGANLPYSAYGDGGKSRDVNRTVVAEIIDAFIEAFYTPQAVEAIRARRTPRPEAVPSDAASAPVKDDEDGGVDESPDGGLVGKLTAAVRTRQWNERPLVKGGGKHGWYMPNKNVYPLRQSMFDKHLDRLIRRHVLPGHVPDAPLLHETDTVVTLGSCFARELRAFLSASGIDSTRFWIPSGLNNTFAILDFFSWCVTGKETGRGYRYERSDGGEIKEWKPEAERHAYGQLFADAGAFVFTIGLAEVWQDRETGAVFWRGVPEHVFDADRHTFRLTTVEENTENIKQIVALVRQINPKAPIILTLSPVPLLASFREISCLTADCVSKSVLRVALDQVMSEQLDAVYYWPSFEIVKWVGATLPYPAYGEGGKARDVNRRVVAEIINAFIESFYTAEAVSAIRTRNTQNTQRDADALRAEAEN